jgi:hypothetical protein
MPMTLVGHPAWCDPTFCESAEYGDVLHRSAPVSWELAEDDVEVTLRRRQIGQAGDPAALYEMTVAHLAYPEEQTVTFSETDLNVLFGAVRALRVLD